MAKEKAFHTFPRIETKNLLLRRIHTHDASALFEILSDDAVSEFFDDDAFVDISQARDQIENWETGYQNQRCLRWGITRKGENQLIGTGGYYGFHSWNKRASIGYELARIYWRQGLMTEALGAIIDFGFGNFELNRIEAVIMPGNMASINLLEKIGFENEGLLREYERWGNKGFVDLCMFALLRKEWGRSNA
jgi:ribosomal-protein-alanine N-acetyltransferase